MGRGRGRGGRSSRGRGRKIFSSKRGNSRPKTTRKEERHIRMFGEKHPSQDVQEFGQSSSSATGVLDGNRKRTYDGRGREVGSRNFERSHKLESSEEDDSDLEDEKTPYNELLSLFKKKKGENMEFQILSDEEDVEEEGEGLLEENWKHKDSEPEEAIENFDSRVNENRKDDTEADNGQNLENEDETVIAETEISEELENEGTGEEECDPYLLHFERSLPEILLGHLKDDTARKIQGTFTWPEIDNFSFVGMEWRLLNDLIKKERDLTNSRVDFLAGETLQPLLLPQPPSSSPRNNFSLETFNIKHQIKITFPLVNQKVVDSESCGDSLSPLQKEMLEIFSQYFDGYFPIQSIQNDDAIKNAYCLHAANHVLKTRTRIIHHNAKLVDRVDVPDTFRDQGFARPKVLILVPFKSSALKVIQILISILLQDQKGNVINKKRFIDEYGGSTLFLPKTNPKPDDYNEIFSGNTEDNFKIGISLTKKTVKLFTGFYSSDIIVASPLGLRLIIGAEGERDRDYDFLSSIEMLIMDQADIFLMQNWDHVLHAMRHLNLQPITNHGTDFARIRPWALDGLTKYFRQTLIFSSVFCPEHSSLMTKHCHNYAGQVKLQKQFIIGSISGVTVQMPQVFQYFDATSIATVDDERFEFLIKTVIPSFTDKLMSHTLIFVSSYFDFVRLRNHFKREQKSFVQMCEYTKDKKVARARDYFFHGQAHFLLYTERVHFFRRFRLKGIGHILFYQLPQYTHFYPELCNLVREDFQKRKVSLRKNSSVTVMYCKYDTPRLAAVVGTDRASHMLSSDKTVHAFISGEI